MVEDIIDKMTLLRKELACAKNKVELLTPKLASFESRYKNLDEEY